MSNGQCWTAHPQAAKRVYRALVLAGEPGLPKGERPCAEYCCAGLAAA